MQAIATFQIPKHVLYVIAATAECNAPHPSVGVLDRFRISKIKIYHPFFPGSFHLSSTIVGKQGNDHNLVIIGLP